MGLITEFTHTETVVMTLGQSYYGSSFAFLSSQEKKRCHGTNNNSILGRWTIININYY